MRIRQLVTTGGLSIAVLGLGCAGGVGSAAAGTGKAKQATNLLKNPGFEKPVVPVGGYTVYGVGQKFPGWKIVGAAGSNINPVSGSYTDDGCTLNTEAGAQYMDLTGTTNTMKTGVSQSAKTTKGDSYTLSFWVGNVNGPGTELGTSSTIEVKVDGSVAKTVTNSGGDATSQFWKQYTLTFKATSASTTVAFLNEDPSNDTSNGLDTVSLTKS